MNVPLFVISITIVCALGTIWLILGFLGFLLEIAYSQSYSTFDTAAKKNCAFSLVLGPILIIVLGFMYLSDKFVKFMNQYIENVNKIKKNKGERKTCSQKVKLQYLKKLALRSS